MNLSPMACASVVALAAIVAVAEPAMSSTILYKETAGSLSTTSGAWTPIPGLKFTLPAASASQKDALIILNLPNPYATGTNFPGGMIGISVNGTPLLPFAAFTYDTQAPQSFGRMPTTLVLHVKLLNNNTQVIQTLWQSIRSSTVVIDTPASLSAMIS